MEERANLQHSYDKLNQAYGNISSRLDLREEERKCQQNLLLHADIICCTLSGAGSKCMVQTFKNKYSK